MNTDRLEALLWARIDGTIEPEELAELEAFARDEHGLDGLQAWDMAYYGEKLRQQRFAISQEELRQWLREAIDRQLGQPLVGFLKQLKVLGGLLQAFGDTIGSLLQAINAKLEAYYNVDKPDGAPDYSIAFQWSFLFPK